ncbi:MAG: glycosyltransferase [Deltaproteobacteria bacterium]|nr:MAG: glycosyltransferase [Deltaproteobacteria bacterium]
MGGLFPACSRTGRHRFRLYRHFAFLEWAQGSDAALAKACHPDSPSPRTLLRHAGSGAFGRWRFRTSQSRSPPSAEQKGSRPALYAQAPQSPALVQTNRRSVAGETHRPALLALGHSGLAAPVGTHKAAAHFHRPDPHGSFPAGQLAGDDFLRRISEAVAGGLLPPSACHDVPALHSSPPQTPRIRGRSNMSAFYYLVPAESRYKLFHETWGRYVSRRLFHPQKRYPTGGVQVIYQHVGMLQKHGVEAHVVHLGDFRVDWFEHAVEPITIDQAKIRIGQNDVLVVPERIPQWASEFSCRRKLAFVQNWGLVENAVGRGDYADFGFTGVVCCGSYLKNWMETHTALPIWLVGNGIDLEKFKPEPANRRPGSLLYLRRKPTWILGDQALRRLSPHLRRTLHAIVLPHYQTQHQMIEAYQQADIFIPLGFPEGFSLPPLEAMACGCAVVGFSGGGGLDFMKDGQTALVVPDGDVAMLAQAVERILTDSDLREKIRRNGMVEARTFGSRAMEENLMLFARNFLS